MGNTLETVTAQRLGGSEIVIPTLSFTLHLSCSM